MKLSYKFRLYPTRPQRDALDAMLRDFCELYNAGLQQRIEAWRRQRLSLTYAAQTAELKAVRAEHSGLARWSFTAEQQVLRRLDIAFKAFFSRKARNGKASGYPRFRASSRYHAAGFRLGDGMTLKTDGKLGVVGLPGVVKVKWHRDLPSAPKSAVVTRQGGRWFVIFHVEVPPENGREAPFIGIDAGLRHLAALSNGETFPRSNWTKRNAKSMRRRHRQLSRAKAGSKRCAKKRTALALFYASIARRRRDELHKISADITRRFGRIAVEDLNVRGLARGMLAREIHDAAWGQLISMLDYKAAKAGGRLVRVDPRGTSQTCPECGTVRAKSLSERVHRCECGAVLDRDVAAARIVHIRAFGPGTGLQSPSQRVAA